jgi:hypothetical protein
VLGLIGYWLDGSITVNWTAHTHHWTLETGATVWLTTDAREARVPPAGADMPIMLGDSTVIQTIVLGSTPRAIVIELDSGHLRRLTPVAPDIADPPRDFPGSPWIVQRRA